MRRHRNFELLGATVGAMKGLADGEQLRVVVAFVPSKEEVYSWVLDDGAQWSAGVGASAFSAEFEAMARRNEMPFLDLKPALVGASRREFEQSGALLRWGGDTHWNPLAQRVASEVIHRELLLPLGHPFRL